MLMFISSSVFGLVVIVFSLLMLRLVNCFVGGLVRVLVLMLICCSCFSLVMSIGFLMWMLLV